MTSPSLELQRAIVPHLKADAPLAALIGARIYDHVPQQPGWTDPYVSLGAASEIDDGHECIDAVSVMFRIDVWSRAVGYGEALRIADAIKRALHHQDLELPDNALVEIRWRRTDRMRDPDGLTSHAVVEFTASIENP